jgi:hypothetical protein
MIDAWRRADLSDVREAPELDGATHPLRHGNEIEILVLRHQVGVLQRRGPRLRISWTDRAVIAALGRLLPTRRRLGLLVTPSTILRWHRHLARRRWTTPLWGSRSRPGRVTCSDQQQGMIAAMALRLGRARARCPVVFQNRRTRCWPAVIGGRHGDLRASGCGLHLETPSSAGSHSATRWAS